MAQSIRLHCDRDPPLGAATWSLQAPADAVELVDQILQRKTTRVGLPVSCKASLCEFSTDNAVDDDGKVIQGWIRILVNQINEGWLALCQHLSKEFFLRGTQLHRKIEAPLVAPPPFEPKRTEMVILAHP